MAAVLTQELASRFARIALGHVTREYPNKPGHILRGPEDARTPRELHPLFFGSFDWHSCVHGYWLLCRLSRRFPELPECAEIHSLLARQLAAENVLGELDYFRTTDAFERPYGWAWLLMLASELEPHESAAGRSWAAALAPLAEFLAAQFLAFLPFATYPVRSGAHFNSAFAVTLAWEYARVPGNDELKEALREKTRAWFERDADCQAWEPSGDDFLSPALMEALAMQRTMAADRICALVRPIPASNSQAEARRRYLNPPRSAIEPTARSRIWTDSISAGRGAGDRSRARSLRTIRAVKSRSRPPRRISPQASRTSRTTMRANIGSRLSRRSPSRLRRRRETSASSGERIDFEPFFCPGPQFPVVAN